jgi:nanoRNase/pAp phosphatase (c-di-AMP/oligoRNAs hydrolase)
MKKNIVVIYHANCPDGFGAAFSFYQKFGNNAEYIPVTYSDPIPELSGKEVYIVDFCYHKEKLLEIKKVAKSIVVLDHHKTAMEECSELEFCHFDMESSGCCLAWKFCFPNQPIPNILRYIEDRDLWNWNLSYSREILAVIDSEEKTFENWDILSSKLSSVGSQAWVKVLNKGEGIVQYSETLIKNLIKNAHSIYIDGVKVQVVNTAFFQSEIGNRLSVGQPFAGAYYWDGSRYCFSLRSQDDGLDVSEIAKKYGGGGHARASGFTVTDISSLITPS